MKIIQSIFRALIVGIGILMIIISLLSLIGEITFWLAKSLDFPRLQYLIISVICLLSFILILKKWNLGSLLLVLGLVISIFIHARKIAPYYLGPKVVDDAEHVQERESSVKIIIANVLMTNRNSKGLIKIIKDQKPDMVLVMEVDEWWINELQSLTDVLSNSIKYPLDNAYGMALYSRYELKDFEIKFLKHADVPSFHGNIILPSGKEFSFHGVHPVAPFPSSIYPDNIGEEEVALAEVGRIVAQTQLPAIVAGDFNDVSWSSTTQFFEDRGDLKNLRLGRGLFNTFNAQSWFMRWPLDHFFVTEHFQSISLERLEPFGSDHFPLMAEFVLYNSK